MSIQPYPWPVRYLPAKNVCSNKNDIPKYEAMSDEDKKKYGGLWWSMHDIIDVFGGFVKEENDANYFNFVVDFSSPEMTEAKIVEPALVNLIDTQMTTNLTELSNKIQNDFQNQQLASSAAMSAAVTGVASANRPFPAMPVAPMPGMPTAPMPGMPAVPGMPGAVPGAVPGAPPEPSYSAKNLEKECFKDMSRIPITSKSRIFVVQKDLPPVTAAMKERIETKGDFEKLMETPPVAEQGINLGPVPAPIVVGGRISKTRKGKKSQKKRKTRKYKRRLPFGKR